MSILASSGLGNSASVTIIKDGFRILKVVTILKVGVRILKIGIVDQRQMD